MEQIGNKNDERLSRHVFIFFVFIHDLSRLDVLLLVDAFEKFRNNSLKHYWLCPSHYLSAPALSWDVLLNMTKDKLISDLDIYIFFEKGMRGVVSYISN